MQVKCAGRASACMRRQYEAFEQLADIWRPNRQRFTDANGQNIGRLTQLQPEVRMGAWEAACWEALDPIPIFG
jgi:hypothetical protein